MVVEGVVFMGVVDLAAGFMAGGREGAFMAGRRVDSGVGRLVFMGAGVVGRGFTVAPDLVMDGVVPGFVGVAGAGDGVVPGGEAGGVAGCGGWGVRGSRGG